jgi:hypothetical protein
VRLTLFAPGAGVTAQGVTYAFGKDGRPAPSPVAELAGAGVPQRVRTAVKEAPGSRGGYTFEALLPAQALPRFPWRGPLLLELCVEVAGASNCQGGTMQGPLLRLPDSVRAALGLQPPEAVEAVEGRPQGWVGWDAREQLVWAAAGQAMEAATLRALVAPRSLDPRALNIALPPTLALPDGSPLVALFEGEDPYGEGGACRGDEEVRLRLFVLRGPAAHRVLDWPVVSCKGGRARAVVLDEEGDLSIGYSTGAILHFLWSGDHFERTEIGLR